MAAAVRLAPLASDDRADLEAAVRSTGVFNEEEVGVALELFDESLCESRVTSHESRVCDYEFVGAFDGDRLVGYACYGPTPATDGTWDLYWIAVHRDAQRSGAGSLLMSEVEHRLHARGVRLLVVETSSRAVYEPTRRFYARRGYAESIRVRDFYARGDDRVILTKSMGGRVPSPDSRVPIL